MGVTKSQFESQDPGVLSVLGDQLSEASGTAAEQLSSQSGVLQGMSEHFRGSASDLATNKLDQQVSGLQSSLSALRALGQAVCAAHSELVLRRNVVTAVVENARSQDFEVGDDWSVTDSSGKPGLRRAAMSRDVAAELKSAVDQYNTADQAAGDKIGQALGQFHA